MNTTQRSTMYSMLSRAPPSVKTRQLSASEATATTQISLHLHGHQHVMNGRTSQTRLLPGAQKTTILSHNAGILRKHTGCAKKKRSERSKDIGNLAQKMLRMFQKEKDPAKQIIRQTSAGSANTISNSSLQDMDEIDFSSSDLVKYMEEINGDLA